MDQDCIEEAIRDFRGPVVMALLIPPLADKTDREIETMSALLASDTGDTQFRSWDWRYYDSQLLRNEFSVDQDAVAEYFPLDAVLDGLFGLSGEVFGLEYRELPEPTAWHPDVRLFEVLDSLQKSAFVKKSMIDRYIEAAIGPGIEQPVQPIHRPLVRRAFGGHLDDLALEQLDTVVPREDPGLDHPVIVLHGEPSALELDRRIHRSAPNRFSSRQG